MIMMVMRRIIDNVNYNDSDSDNDNDNYTDTDNDNVIIMNNKIMKNDNDIDNE